MVGDPSKRSCRRRWVKAVDLRIADYKFTNLIQHVDEAVRDDGQDDARQEFDDDRVHPEVKVVEELLPVPSQVGEAEVVEGDDTVSLQDRCRPHAEH